MPEPNRARREDAPKSLHRNALALGGRAAWWVPRLSGGRRTGGRSQASGLLVPSHMHVFLQILLSATLTSPSAPGAPLASIAPPPPTPTASAPVAVVAPAPAGPRADVAAFRLRAAWPADSAPQRAKAVEYSDAYATRLSIHKWASFLTLPLFIGQYVTGEKLYDELEAEDDGFDDDAEGSTKNLHSTFAGGIAGLFVVNSVTGIWNLIEARHDPNGKKLRTWHSVLMLVADAGFVATGVLANSAEDASGRDAHKTVAIGSSLVALTGYAIMLPSVFGKD